MNKYLLLNLLKQGGYFMLNKILIKELGLVETAVLSLLLDMNEQHGDEFFVTSDTAQQTLNIGRRPYDSAISNLKEKGIISTYLKDSPPKTYFVIDFEVLSKYFEFVQNRQLNLYKTDNLICTKRTTNNNKDNNISSVYDSKESQTSPKESDTFDEEFLMWYDSYGKKVEKPNAWKMWKRLSRAQKYEVIAHTPAYVSSTPDKQYRMNPATYLNPANKRWLDEIIVTKQQPQQEDHVYS